MVNQFQKILSLPIVRYILVGGSAYLIEITVILGAQRLGLNSILAVGISFWIGLLYTFVLQKFFSFKDRRSQSKVLLTQVALVTVLVLFNFVFTICLTATLQHKVQPIVSRTIAIAITTLWNFYLYKNHIFKEVVLD
jgi:putative flippase GtrA